MFERSLALPEAGRETFFLWGPRQAGKSTLLRRRYPDALWVDLLKSEVFRRYPRSSRAVAPGVGIGGGARRAAGRDRRGPEGAGAARRGALADRESRAPLRPVRVERPQGAPRRRQSARRARRTLRAARAHRRRAGLRLRPGPHAEPRLPAAHLPGGPSAPPARRLRRRLLARGGRRRGSGPQPAGVFRLPGRRRVQRRRDGQLLQRRPRVRCIEPHRQGLLRDSGRHAARTPAERLPPAAQAACDRRSEVLLRRRGGGEPADAARSS